MAPSSKRTGLADYSRTKARVRKHDTYVKRTFLGSSQSSLFLDEEEESSERPVMTMQQFRQSLIRPEDEEGEVTFQLRFDRKRWRNGSTHSLSKGRYNYCQDEQGHYTKVAESPKTPPSRTLSGKSKILVRAPSHENLELSTEDASAYGYGHAPPRRCSKIPALVADEVVRRNPPTIATMDGIQGEASESEQTETSASEQSITFESASDSTQSASLSSSCTLSGLRKRSRNNASGTSSQNGNPMIPVQLQTSCPSISEDGSDGEKPNKQALVRERPMFFGFGSNGYVRSYPIRNPSDSDESFTSFAQKYSRYSQPVAGMKTQKCDADSCMDLHESYSSFASFAEDDDWATKSVGPNKLLDGGEEESEEEDEAGAENEDEISLGDQSPDSVIVDLTSVSTSVNSNSQSLSLSLSPRSSSKASLSRERRSVVPLNDTKGSRHLREDKRVSRHRRDAIDGCSVGSAISRHSNRSGGSWLSRHSKKSAASRFSRLEEYLNKDNNRNRLGGSKEAGSKISHEKKDDISTTSSITMGTFRTNETKDSEWKKLSDVVESKEVPATTAVSKEDSSTLKHINSNPFLAADRQKNVPVKNKHESHRKTTKVWKPPASLENTSPIKNSSLKSTSGNVETLTTFQSPTKTPETTPRRSAARGALEPPFPPESPTKTPATSPRKLALDRLSPFAHLNDSVPDVARVGVGVGRGKSFESPVNRSFPPNKTPSRSTSSEGRLGGDLNEIACTPLSSPTRAARTLSSPVTGTVETAETTKSGPRSCKKPIPARVHPKTSAEELTPKREAETQKPELLEEKTGVPKAAAYAKQFQQPVLSPTPNKGINIFNPSAISKGPTKQNFPRFVGDHVNSASSPANSLAKKISSPFLKPVPVSSASQTDSETKKAPGNASVPKKESKVQSYLRKCKEQNPKAVSNDIVRAASKESEPSPRSPVRQKGDGNTAVRGNAHSSKSSKGPTIKSRMVKRADSTSAAVPTSEHLSRNNSEDAKKPSRRGLAASRVRIDLFLEKDRKHTEEEEVFREPVPSPWRPSTTTGRNRHRASDSNSRASSMASSKYSTASGRTSAVSMFQPHQQVSVTSLPGNHSPTRSENKSVVSFDGSVDNKPKLSMVEQRKLLFQGENQSNGQGARSFGRKSRVGGHDEPKPQLTLPSASEISDRVSSWHNVALMAD